MRLTPAPSSDHQGSTSTSCCVTLLAAYGHWTFYDGTIPGHLHHLSPLCRCPRSDHCTTGCVSVSPVVTSVAQFRPLSRVKRQYKYPYIPHCVTSRQVSIFINVTNINRKQLFLPYSCFISLIMHKGFHKEQIL